MPKIILASSSPRRKQLLEMLLKNFGIKFKVIPSMINESGYKASGKYPAFVQQLALDKAMDVASQNRGIIIGADTVVVFKNKMISKPVSNFDAKRILNLLSGNMHTVYTGIAIVDSVTKKIFIDYESTKVTFRKLSSKEINKYIHSGSPMDKAGAYGIQDDYGSTFVNKINGDYFNVVGLPIVKTYLGLKNFLRLD